MLLVPPRTETVLKEFLKKNIQPFVVTRFLPRCMSTSPANLLSLSSASLTSYRSGERCCGRRWSRAGAGAGAGAGAEEEELASEEERKLAYA